MRKIGINVSQNVAYGAEAFMESIAKAGFDSVFTVGNDAAFVAYIARKCAQTGLKYEALHAPYLRSMTFGSRTRKATRSLRRSANRWILQNSTAFPSWSCT